MTIFARLGVLLVLTELALAAADGRAQAPAGMPAAGTRLSCTSRRFRLPFTITESAAAGVREVRLYVKCGLDASWTLTATALPGQKYFTFVAPQDGEYAFLIATVDQAGHMTPADVAQEAPDCVVLVKLQPAEPDVPGTATNSAASEIRLTAAPAAPAAVETQADKVASPMPAAESATPARHLINSTHATLNYEVEQPGTGGGKIEVWVTSPKGQTWRRLCEVPANHKGPAEIELPGEGVFGLSLVSNTGLGESRPPAGVTPDFWVEVDTTQPQGQLLSATLENGAGGDSLVIRWAASDKNLGPRPISLFYAIPDGSWLPIAEALANEGVYRWTLPREVGPSVFLRLDVTDAAGNCCHCQLPQPVVCSTAPPKVRVLGIAASAARTPPQGN
jgi:hypothetical protein